MKIQAFLFLLLTSTISIAQTITFSEVNLLNALINKGVDTNNDSLISMQEAAVVTELDLHGINITTISELIHFPLLTRLGVENNQLTSIPDSVFKNLTYFNGTNNLLSSLPNVVASDLDFLIVERNQLTVINLSNATGLLYLSVHSNPIPSIDVSALTKLEELRIDSTLITQLDLTGLGALNDISAFSIELDSLISHAAFVLPNNNIWHFGKIYNIDYSNNSSFISFSANWYPNFKSLNFSNCSNLTSMNLSQSPSTLINLENDTSLQAITISGYGGNQSLCDIVKGCHNIETVSISSTNDTSLSCISQFVKLKNLTLTTTSLDSVLIQNHPALSSISLSGVTNLIVENSPALTQISGGVTNARIVNCDNFVTVNTDVNLAELIIEDCDAFSSFPVNWNTYANSIKKIRFINCPSIIELNISWYSSGVTELDLTGCTGLKSLYCSGQQLTSLDLSTNTALETLECNSNQLTTLDISVVPSLLHLNCNTNLLKMLDMRHAHNLNHLNVATTDSAFYVCFNDTTNIGIATLVPTYASDSSHTLYRECHIVTKFDDLVDSKTSKQIVRAFDIIGRSVNINTTGEIIIVEYQDGTREKIFQKN